MTHLSAEESKQRDQDVLGVSYGAAFYHCRQLLWNVSANWDRYETLFGSKERVEILNVSSGNFWGAFQDMLHEHVLLGVCRLTDPAAHGRFQNMSISRLLALDPTNETEGLRECIEVAVERTAFARSWRDKRIAHNDFAHIAGDGNAIEPSTGNKISEAIVAIHDVLRWIQARYFDGEMFLIDIGDSDANLVMMDLARARAMKEQERADLAAKRYDALLLRRSLYPAESYGREQRYKTQSTRPLPASYRGTLPLST